MFIVYASLKKYVPFRDNMAYPNNIIIYRLQDS